MSKILANNLGSDAESAIIRLIKKCSCDTFTTGGYFFLSALFINSLLFYRAEVYSFELLSEGAMGSVSGTPGLVEEEHHLIDEQNDDYEELPFETSVKVNKFDTNEVSIELEFSLTEEVNAWANKLREKGDTQLEIGIVDELPSSSFEIPSVIIQDGSDAQGTIQDVSTSGDSGKANYQRGRSTQSTELLESGANSVRFKVESYVERAATLDANPFQEKHSFGSTYISDLNSASEISIQAR